jgi:predicted NBD/HSP70 family sugar kinase
VRRMNLVRVLAEIRDHPGATRKDLVAATDLNRVTVLDLVTDLQKRRLVDEAPVEATGRSGRPAMALRLDDRRLAVAALEVNIDRISIRCATLELRTVHEESVEMAEEGHSVGRVLDLTLGCIERARSATAELGLELTHICIGLPAFIDHRSGTVITSLNFGWSDVPFADLVRERAGGGLEVTLDRLANLAILEERAVDDVPQTDGIVLLYGDMGVGGAFQKDGAVLRGDTGTGAEFGHISVEPNGPECYCGNRGCLETYVGIRALAAVLGVAEGGDAGIKRRTVALLGSEDPGVRAAVRSQAPWLARAVRTLSAVFDPRVIVLGGHLAALAHLMGSAIGEEIGPEVRGHHVDLRISAAGSGAVLTGGVRAARDALLAAPWSV